MKRKLMAAAVCGALALPGMAQAQNFFDIDQPPVGKAAGTFMMRARAIGVIPLNSSSSVSPIGGTVSTTNYATPELDFSYFFTDNIAVELIAATSMHNLAAENVPGLGHVSVGNIWALPPTLTVQYHFFPKERFSPYIGAGINLSLFYGAKTAGPTVTSLSVDTAVGGALQVGFDYALGGHWYANVDVKQIFLSTTANIGTVLGRVKAKTDLNPLVIGVGIGYRF